MVIKTNTHVILWTKLSGDLATQQEVVWEVSSDRSFNNIISRGESIAYSENDYTVKVDANIPLNSMERRSITGLKQMTKFLLRVQH